MFQAPTCLVSDLAEPDVASAPPGQLPRWHGLRTPGAVSDPGPCSFLFCITLYNEAPALLKNTLDAIASNLLDLASAGHAPHAVVCIVADGHGCMHDSTRAWCEGLGLMPVGPSQVFNRSDQPALGLQHCTMPLRALRAHCGQCPEPDGTRDIEIQLMMGIKACNAGKLDSHARFFREILPAVPCRYVLQMDTGSELSPHCLGHLWRRMQSDSRCAALAPNVSTEASARWNDVLQTWQYFDFLIDKIVHYPLRSLIGHLELLPGQCTLFRRSALLKKGGEENVLDRYLSGLHVTGLLARNTFLTEDRVIAHDLSLGQGESSTLHYAACAHVRTDRCETAGELFRQRRRWLNGTLASRFYALRYILAYVRGRTLPWTLRFAVPLMLVTASLQAAAQLLYPALLAFASSCAAVMVGSWLGVRWTTGLATTGALLFLLQWYGATHRCWKDPEQALRGRSFFDPLILLSLTLTATFCVLIFSAAPAVIIMGASALGLICVAIIASKGSRALYLARLLLIYLPTRTSISLLLMSYAMLNFSNLSWGTKGLDKPMIEASSKDRRVGRYLMGGWQLLTGIATAFLVAHIHVLCAYVTVVMAVIFLNALTGAAFSLLAVVAAHPWAWPRR